METSLYIKDVLLSSGIDKESYLSTLPAVAHLMESKKLSFSEKVTFFVGENGTGKSTLLEAIAVAYGFNPEGGTKNFLFSTNDTHSELCDHLTLSKKAFPKDGFFLRAESFYNVASYVDDVGAVHNYGGTSLHQQSHGESFLALVQNRLSGNGLYLFDEPEAALSPTRLLVLLAEIHRLADNNSQFIIATHSPILMAFPNAEILEFSEKGIQPKKYKDTEHYQITRRFLENPEKMLKYLLED